jgi:hypothetical protein
MDEERRSSTLKWKKLPIFMDEVHRHSNENRIKFMPTSSLSNTRNGMLFHEFYPRSGLG